MRDFSIKYVNASGEAVSFDSFPQYANDTDALGYAWDVQTSENGDGLGSKLSRFGRASTEVSVAILLLDLDDVSSKIDTLTAFFEKDVVNQTPGRLYVNDYYITGYVKSCKPSNRIRKQFVQINIAFISGSAFWMQEELHSFPIYTEAVAEGFSFPLAFPFHFAATLDARQLVNDHYVSCKSIITLYGPATDPEFTLGTHVYKVYGALGEAERYVINQLDRTVTRITQAGERLNAFGYRGKEYSVFDPIPAGENTLYSSGEFAIDILLLKERSAPLWS